MAAEDRVKSCEAQVATASTGDHVHLTKACGALETAQAEVEKLYIRWQELEAKRAGTL
jgi:ATP-binding cassette subfamily F protein uup